MSSNHEDQFLAILAGVDSQGRYTGGVHGRDAQPILALRQRSDLAPETSLDKCIGCCSDVLVHHVPTYVDAEIEADEE